MVLPAPMFLWLVQEWTWCACTQPVVEGCIVSGALLPTEILTVVVRKGIHMVKGEPFVVHISKQQAKPLLLGL